MEAVELAVLVESWAVKAASVVETGQTVTVVEAVAVKGEDLVAAEREGGCDDLRGVRNWAMSRDHAGAQQTHA